MSKHKVITSIGVICIVTGIVGGTWSGIKAIPTIINKLNKIQNQDKQAVTLYNENEKVDKINIDAKCSNVYIRKHNEPTITVQRLGNKELSNISFENKNGQLNIKEDYINKDYNIKNIDDMTKQWVDRLYQTNTSDIIVYLPEKINLDVTTDYTELVVEDDCLLDTINYETSSGQIVLEGDTNLENLNIKSSNYISLETKDINGAKNVNIIAREVDINGNGAILDESKIPENLSIKTTNTNYEEDSLDIDSTVPIAKNLYIDSISTVDIELPIVDYKFNFDVNTSRGIVFSSDNINKYINTAVEKYFTQGSSQEIGALKKQFKGLLNEELMSNKNEYFVKINSSYTVFE